MKTIHSGLIRLVVVGASTLLMSVLAFGHVATPVRPLLTFWFLIVCPGLAWTWLLRLRDPWVEAGLAVTLSVTVDIAISLPLVYLQHLTANLAFTLLLIVTFAGLGLQTWQLWRNADGESGVTAIREPEEA